MNLEYVKHEIKAILDSSCDEESTHAHEDELNESFIAYIASLTPDTLANERIEIVAMAEELKKLTDKNLARWYA